MLLPLFALFILCAGVSARLSFFMHGLKKKVEKCGEAAQLEKYCMDYIDGIQFKDFRECSFSDSGFHLEVRSMNRALNPAFTDAGYLSEFFDDRGLFLKVREFQAQGNILSPEELDSIHFEEGFMNLPFMNVNLCPEKVLDKVLSFLSDEEACYGLLQEKKGNHLIRDNLSLYNLYPGSFDVIFPSVNAYPLLDINYADEKIIEKILSSDKFGMKNALSISRKIVEKRKAKLLDENDLNEILSHSSCPELFCFLGCRSYLWNIKASFKNSTIEMIFALTPEENNFVLMDRSRKYLVRKRILK